MQIHAIKGREILDSRANPTVEAEIILDNGIIGRASVPSGASCGSKEAHELRDKDKQRFQGKGVQKSVSFINTIIHESFKGQPLQSQEELDARLKRIDGSADKSHLGANTLLAVSLAYARALALTKEEALYQALNHGEKMCLPLPLFNILNGGAHADNRLDIQEFMIMPIGASNFPEALQMGAEVFHCLKTVLKQKGLNTAVGDEGGFAPHLDSNRQALDLLSEAVQHSGYRLGKDLAFALDVAASELWENGAYVLASENKKLSTEDLIAYYSDLINHYPIISMEDALDENDWEGWKLLSKTLGAKVQLVGDDLFVTNPALLKKGIAEGVANAILIKPNQIGTLTETRETIALAQANGYRAVISHRSGETEDSFIADLAVATGAGQIKAGSLCRSDRVAKYNQLLRIHDLSGLPFAGEIFSSFKKNR